MARTLNLQSRRSTKPSSASSFFKSVSLVFGLALFALGCTKNHDETRANATSIAEGPVIAEFSSLDPKAWVNGSPVSLNESRGKHVLLIEAWHPA